MHDQKNLAFIDGQNLYMGTARREGSVWRIDLARFRTYLREKYRVHRAFYFLGFFDERYRDLYQEIRMAGFEPRFKPHGARLASRKKGNVDTDVIFDVMRRLCEKEDTGKIVLVSGDGDYKAMVDFLLKKGCLGKVLAPCRASASSLYKTIRVTYFDCLDTPEIKRKIQKT